MAQIADYTFDDTPNQTGTTANDSAGPDLENGVYQGGAVASGGAAQLDGAGDYLEIPADPDFGLTQGTIVIDFTAATGSLGDKMTLFSVDSTDYDGGGHLTVWIMPTGLIEVRHQTDDASFYYSGGPITEGVPVSMAYSFGPDGSTLVIDGTVVDTGTQPHVMAGDVEPIVIGASQWASSVGEADNVRDFFEGSIERVQIHDKPIASGGAVPCFAAGTLIDTPSGPVAVEGLRPGDLVLTAENGPQPVRWVGCQPIRAADLAAFPGLRPVVIRAGALGNTRPLTVSRQHCLVVRDRGAEVLVRAVHLAKFGRGLARIANGCRQVDYHHLLLDRHEVIFANGSATESLFPGPSARTLAAGLQTALTQAATPATVSGRVGRITPCRPVLLGAQARALLARHAVRTDRSPPRTAPSCPATDGPPLAGIAARPY